MPKKKVVLVLDRELLASALRRIANRAEGDNGCISASDVRDLRSIAKTIEKATKIEVSDAS